MNSAKLQRINEDIQRVLSDRLRQVKDPRVSAQMISITEVDTTGDLKQCNVYLSILGDYNEKEFKKGLKSASGWLRRELGNTLSLRNTPELFFHIDNSIERGAYISKLLDGLNISSDEEDQDGN